MTLQLEIAAMAAYKAFSRSAEDRLGVMPPWEATPPEARADWRAVADAVLIMNDLATSADRQSLLTGDPDGS